MSFSRKHYCAVAAIIASDRTAMNTSYDYRAALESVAHRMADHYQADNPKFNRARFLAACKVTS
jgi:hypothetical protein